MNVLVTGCGGDIGQSIGKILKEISFVDIVIGCDIFIETPSKFIYDKLLKSLPCYTDGYLKDLENKIEIYNIDLLVPISEPEIRFFSVNNIYFIKKCRVLIANKKSTQIGFDKFNTAELLKLEGLPYPKTFLIEDLFNVGNELNLPVIIKSRFGSGSKNMFHVETSNELNFYQRKLKNYIVQEKIKGENNEFTCGLFRSRNGEIRVLIINRLLTGGFTGFGRIEKNKQIEVLLIQLAKKLDLVGSINVQLKLLKSTPYIFEINPRFSSTVRFRDLIGFKDLLWTIQDLFELNIDDYTPVSEGVKFYKGYNEYIEQNEN